MKSLANAGHYLRQTSIYALQNSSCKLFLAGLLFPLGYSPFNYPGLTLLSLAFFYAYLVQETSFKQTVLASFSYGIGLFGLGVSWVIISVHDYGHLNYILSGCVTFIFILYLSSYVAFTGSVFYFIGNKKNPLISGLIFSALWCISEFSRATLFTGFPWLLAGTSQIDVPLKFLAPVIGSYGLSFIACFSASLLANSMRKNGVKRYIYLAVFVALLIFPLLLKSIQWTRLAEQPLTTAIIQANLSMRDKWDESLFWQILNHYQEKTEKYLGKDLIVMPESAIPLPGSYVEDFLQSIDKKAKTAKTAVVLGILQSTEEEMAYSNSIITLGKASGEYSKRHLVPFGEYIPALFRSVNKLLMLPEPGLISGPFKQPSIRIKHMPVASLICYEIAYPSLLRQQMPEARWIISVSDNGWFGHSLASYQQIQMARVLSLQTGRFQVIANNDGLSSIINEKGTVIDSLPPFSSGVLQSAIYSATGTTPWIIWGDKPAIIFCFLILIFSLLLKIK
ncbi:apolipoprotein N-acyltransferase [Legionella israelensis]|uniref:Apolipoprotein N-acyltransferase n=1 Tax=Legionella israelensis TaxID=454 RepID=A0AAX1EGA8_9GAMM|nr:apolipoprotein N-acyltransferase [Legionella israelensis]QBR84119.1 apolipoprotein N-acyltransferase [Legionella israelensis]